MSQNRCTNPSFHRLFKIFLTADIVLVDFNVDFQSDLLVGSFMQSFNFVQLVSEPTYIRGGLIYHVYVNKDFPLFHQLLAAVVPVYYSDHEAVELTTDLFLIIVLYLRNKIYQELFLTFQIVLTWIFLNIIIVQYWEPFFSWKISYLIIYSCKVQKEVTMYSYFSFCVLNVEQC